MQLVCYLYLFPVSSYNPQQNIIIIYIFNTNLPPHQPLSLSGYFPIWSMPMARRRLRWVLGRVVSEAANTFQEHLMPRIQGSIWAARPQLGAMCLSVRLSLRWTTSHTMSHTMSMAHRNCRGVLYWSKPQSDSRFIYIYIRCTKISQSTDCAYGRRLQPAMPTAAAAVSSRGTESELIFNYIPKHSQTAFQPSKQAVRIQNLKMQF